MKSVVSATILLLVLFASVVCIDSPSEMLLPASWKADIMFVYKTEVGATYHASIFIDYESQSAQLNYTTNGINIVVTQSAATSAHGVTLLASYAKNTGHWHCYASHDPYPIGLPRNILVKGSTYIGEDLVDYQCVDVYLLDNGSRLYTECDSVMPVMLEYAEVVQYFSHFNAPAPPITVPETCVLHQP
ncbi:hypothetical protein J8273_8607 [Carpediemonas membranifera]|uniref:Uncharacterized protein n=1 Tax=Carpediemonas membranifera TaxID=201153 RepID=A0A8J6E6U3_9EUKA|nr:hypothetical protein J8273_8607 [Carpediemonas membranifera]|eukprot:KAG9389920.1 hypothetical protein J8273_8607 [Carpediemonas membranifera]